MRFATLVHNGQPCLGAVDGAEAGLAVVNEGGKSHGARSPE